VPHSLRSRLALAVIKRRLPALVAADPVAGLPDGLHVAVVGSGSPIPDPKRGNPCAAVIAGGRVFVVDAGERSAETMARMQLAPNRIAAVLLTHFHSDHIGGLGTVNLQRWVADAATAPLRVIGPPGVERVVAGFNEAYALDSGYRTAHHGPEVAPPSGALMTAQTFSFAEGEDAISVLDEDGLKVTAFVADHAPVQPAVGYRFDYRDRSAVISGDTVYAPRPRTPRETRGWARWRSRTSSPLFRSRGSRTSSSATHASTSTASCGWRGTATATACAQEPRA
jgi:ribonuclease Z